MSLHLSAVSIEGNHLDELEEVFRNFDPEMVLWSGDEWIELSKRWDARVVGWICEGASGSYGLAVYQSGAKVRDVIRVGADVPIDQGEPLDEEEGLDWRKAFEDDVLGIVDRIGAGCDASVDRTYRVFRLDESGMG